MAKFYTLKHKDICVTLSSWHSYSTSYWSFASNDSKGFIKHDDGTYTYLMYGEKEYRFRYDPVPGIGRSHWHRKGPSKYLKYKHFIDLSIADIHPLSYDNESLGDISFKKGKFKGYFWDVAYMKDYDQNCDNYRSHMSWKKKKKRKQWM